MNTTAKLSICAAGLAVVLAACGPAPEPGETPDPTLEPDTAQTDTMFPPPVDTPTVDTPAIY